MLVVRLLKAVLSFSCVFLLYNARVSLSRTAVEDALQLGIMKPTENDLVSEEEQCSQWWKNDHGDQLQ